LADGHVLDALEREAVEIRRLEHEGDRVYREAVASMFDGGIDPMVVIRWKDVYQSLKDAIDRTRQAMTSATDWHSSTPRISCFAEVGRVTRGAPATSPGGAKPEP
jgi:hypothetical protein